MEREKCPGVVIEPNDYSENGALSNEGLNCCGFHQLWPNEPIKRLPTKSIPIRVLQLTSVTCTLNIIKSQARDKYLLFVALRLKADS